MMRDVFRAREVLSLFLLPNFWTGLRLFIFAPLAIYFTVSKEYSLGFTFFLLGAFTDAIDGLVARVTGRITRLGKVIDPSADKLLIVAPAFLAWAYLSHPLLITYFLGELGVVLLSIALLLTKRIIGSKFLGRSAVAFLSFSVVPWLFLLPKTQALLMALNILVGVGTTLRWLSFCQYCFVFRKPLPR
jgi:phosphatidylglycerophosphate synthase